MREMREICGRTEGSPVDRNEKDGMASLQEGRRASYLDALLDGGIQDFGLPSDGLIKSFRVKHMQQ